MRVFNTLTRRKEDFVPRDAGRVSLYVCGPTVYNHIHIGNARTFLSFDVIRRYLTYRGFEVTFVQNVTDVDDKIINKANEEGRSAQEVAEEYTAAFIDAMHALDIADPTERPKATEAIPEMVAMIETLIEKGHAYAVDGDVYFSVRSFPEYGKLSGRDIDEMNAGARVEVDERKQDPLDFALWKSAKPGEPHWPSPWGEGRPGWHIECSAMSEDILGRTFDIHGGASDLIFPHHENELAQSEAALGVPFVRYWLHGGLLQVNAEKMSKSLGNFMLLRDVLGTYSAPVIRLFMLQTHYRSPLDFSTHRLDEATAAYERLENLVRNLRWVRSLAVCGAGVPGDARQALEIALERTRSKFDAEMDDDFNTAGALGAIFELAKAANSFLSEYQSDMCEDDRQVLLHAEELIVELLGVLGIEVEEADASEAQWPREVVALATELAGFEGDEPAEAVDKLLEARQIARAEKDWARADAVRDGLAGLGFTIEDTAQGPRVIYEPKG
ncbi:MAG: cysteine--tRNA ligase [Coriobacteriales bacterium]|nr:cysteine--tRNA ligase [Coriobacteriales bacterium]